MGVAFRVRRVLTTKLIFRFDFFICYIERGRANSYCGAMTLCRRFFTSMQFVLLCPAVQSLTVRYIFQAIFVH